MILSNTNLSQKVWHPEQEVFPDTSTTVVPFTLAGLNQPMLFLQVRDWTDVTHGGNVTPDWWFWYYFGTTNLSDSTLDSNGKTLLYDYQYNLNPNLISFSISITNPHVKGILPVQLNITSGSPSHYGVAIDNTNNATWQPYSGPNFSVSLTTEGWHTVYVGLCGSESGIITWQARPVRADLTPPTLAITSPSSPVQVPLIQLCGSASKPLASISLDISNSAGLKTNQIVVITGQSYNTNTIEYTTSYWQCYDLPLAIGANQITIHATDLAGNQATLATTINCVGRTQPPAITLLWPQNGMRVNGNSITIKGQVDDPTASVSVIFVDATGNTNVYSGLTGRDGVFWIENIPLGASNNVFTLTAANAAGQSSANFTLTQSTVGLSINPIQAGNTTASGTIGTSGYTIWVNGVKAALNGSTWSATIAPITVGGGQVQVTAIPNTDNGGNGSGGSPNGGSGNPSSTQSINAQATVQSPQGSYQSGFHENWQDSVTQWDGYEYSTSITTAIMDWENGGGGHLRRWYGSPRVLYEDDTYPATSWPQSRGDLPLVALEQGNASGTHGSAYISVAIKSEYKMATGGPLGSKTPRLWGVSVIEFPYYSLENYPTSHDASDPFQEISVGGLGKLGPDGTLWTVLPDNNVTDITPNGPAPLAAFLAGGTPYDVAIIANGIALDPNSVVSDANFCVGQNVAFSLSGIPDGVTATNFQWTLDGNFVNKMIPASNTNSSATYTKDTSLLKCAELPNNWWTSGGSPATYTANVSFTLVFDNGNPSRNLSVSGKFTMFRPQMKQLIPIPPYTPVIDDGYLELGTEAGLGTMYFSAQVKSTANFPGNLNWVQLINRSTTYAQSTTGFWLDNDPFYNTVGGKAGAPPNNTSVTTNAVIPFTDNPGVASFAYVSCTDSFKTYLVFSPNTGGSIWVTLGVVTWGWSATEAAWILTSPSVTPPTYSDSAEFPTWTNTIHIRR